MKPEEMYQTGYDFFEDADYVTAAEWFTRAAVEGCADAQVLLGVCYEHGYGVKQSFSSAADWYGKAAAQGHGGAKEALSLLKTAREDDFVSPPPKLADAPPNFMPASVLDQALKQTAPPPVKKPETPAKPAVPPRPQPAKPAERPSPQTTGPRAKQSQKRYRYRFDLLKRILYIGLHIALAGVLWAAYTVIWFELFRIDAGCTAAYIAGAIALTSGIVLRGIRLFRNKYVATEWKRFFRGLFGSLFSLLGMFTAIFFLAWLFKLLIGVF